MSDAVLPQVHVPGDSTSPFASLSTLEDVLNCLRSDPRMSEIVEFFGEQVFRGSDGRLGLEALVRNQSCSEMTTLRRRRRSVRQMAMTNIMPEAAAVVRQEQER